MEAKVVDFPRFVGDLPCFVGCLKKHWEAFYHFSRQVRSTTLLGDCYCIAGFTDFDGPFGHARSWTMDQWTKVLTYLGCVSSYLAQCRESDLRCMAWPCREIQVHALRRKPCGT